MISYYKKLSSCIIKLNYIHYITVIEAYNSILISPKILLREQREVCAAKYRKLMLRCEALRINDTVRTTFIDNEPGNVVG